MKLTDFQEDALKELINIGVGKAASMLNEMVEHHIRLYVPDIQIVSPGEITNILVPLVDVRLAAVRLGFSGDFAGSASLLFPKESVSNLVAFLTGEEPGTPDLDALRIATLTEVGNILVNGVMGMIGNVVKSHMDYALPHYSEDYMENIVAPRDADIEATTILAQTHFTIEELLIEGDIIISFETGSFDSLLAAIDALDET